MCICVIACSISHRLHDISQHTCILVAVMCSAPAEWTRATSGDPQSPLPASSHGDSTENCAIGVRVYPTLHQTRSTLLRTKLKSSEHLRTRETPSSPESSIAPNSPVSGEVELAQMQQTMALECHIWRSAESPRTFWQRKTSPCCALSMCQGKASRHRKKMNAEWDSSEPEDAPKSDETSPEPVY